MATQYQVAYSRDVIGAGIIGAGPWLCAQGVITRALANASQGSAGGPDDRALVATLRASAAVRRRRRSFLARAGPHLALPRQADRTVGAAVSDSLLRFYLRFVPRERIHYETQVQAAHGFPTRSAAALRYRRIAMDHRLRFDAAGKMLVTSTTACASRPAPSRGSCANSTRRAMRGRHRFLRSPRRVPFRAERLRGGQALPAARRVPWLWTRRRLRRPDLSGASRLQPLGRREPHRRALSAGGRSYSVAPFNPRGCWDWWGYSGADYAARNGAQLRERAPHARRPRRIFFFFFFFF